MKPIPRWSCRLAAAAMALVPLVAHVWAAGEEQHPAAAQSATQSMARFYSGESHRVGDFPGTLVCLRCDLKPGPGAMSQCEKEGHRHALSMESDGMVHPLLAATPEVLDQINSGALHGKMVTVHGKYYPSTGAILVDRIAPGK